MPGGVPADAALFLNTEPDADAPLPEDHTERTQTDSKYSAK